MSFSARVLGAQAHSAAGQFGGAWWQLVSHHASVTEGDSERHFPGGDGPGGDGPGGAGVGAGGGGGVGADAIAVANG